MSSHLATATLLSATRNFPNTNWYSGRCMQRCILETAYQWAFALSDHVENLGRGAKHKRHTGACRVRCCHRLKRQLKTLAPRGLPPKSNSDQHHTRFRTQRIRQKAIQVSHLTILPPEGAPIESGRSAVPGLGHRLDVNPLARRDWLEPVRHVRGT